MKYLTPDGEIVKLKKKEAEEKGFLRLKPIYVYVLSKDWLASNESPLFLDRKLNFTSQLSNAHQTKTGWEDFCFNSKIDFFHLMHLVEPVNISLYLDLLRKDFEGKI